MIKKIKWKEMTRKKEGIKSTETRGRGKTIVTTIEKNTRKKTRRKTKRIKGGTKLVAGRREWRQKKTKRVGTRKGKSM